jgi:hypothetical protein
VPNSSGNMPTDVQTIKTQTVTCAAAVTINPQVGTDYKLGVESDGDLTKVNTLDGHTAQTGDSYPIVSHADYGNAKLARSATPANALAINASGQVPVSDKTGFALTSAYNAAKTAAAAGAAMALTSTAQANMATANAAAILAVPTNLLSTNEDGEVTIDSYSQTNIANSIWRSLTSGMTTAGSIGKKLANWVLGSDNMVKVSSDAHTSGQTVKAVTDAVTTDSASREASKNTASEIRDAVGLAAANLDSQLSEKATSAALGAAVTKIDMIDGNVDAILVDTGTTIPAAIAGIEGGGGTGTGARTVAIIVNDGTTALESARVRFTKGAETYVSSTNVSGQVSFSLDDGTWSVAITLAGYSFTPTTLVVNGDETQTYSMTLVSISASDPGFITGYWQCYDEDGVAEVGQTIQMRMKTCSGYGIIYDSKIRSEVSDTTGLATFTNLDPGMTYQVRRGESGKWINVTIPSTATSPYALQSIVGSDE